jgi:hypothetical protein
MDKETWMTYERMVFIVGENLFWYFDWKTEGLIYYILMLIISTKRDLKKREVQVII